MSHHFLEEHRALTRRYFLELGAIGAVASQALPRFLLSMEPQSDPLAGEIDSLEYLTKQDDFKDVSRGKPVPHSLDEERRREVGLTRDTWKLDVISDPDNKADIRNPLSAEKGTSFDWQQLMELAKKGTVSFPKVMTCNNIGCPLGMGIWEGVPLREVFWLTKPRRNIRRLFYYGFHNNVPEQMFRSSLPIGRVLEDPFGLPPVILAFKLNGEYLTQMRGGPVRVVVPEAYGFKSIKWLQRLVVTNLPHANDTYAEKNNDVDSWLKTFAATISILGRAKAGQRIPVTGYAQVGISGLSKVQYWVTPKDAVLPPGDRYFTQAPWKDARILGPPTEWGGGLQGNKVPENTIGFEGNKPKDWPIRLTKAHWAVLLPQLEPGEYDFRCRTVDENGVAQPLPRPFDKSGRVGIEKVRIVVSG